MYLLLPRTFTKCLFRAKHCYSSKLAGHHSSEGIGFLMIVDFFFPSVFEGGGASLLPSWRQGSRHPRVAGSYFPFNEAFNWL